MSEMTRGEGWDHQQNDWNGIVPDSPEGIHDTPLQPEPTERKETDADYHEAAAYAGHMATDAVGRPVQLPVGVQEVGPEQFYG